MYTFKLWKVFRDNSYYTPTVTGMLTKIRIVISSDLTLTDQLSSTFCHSWDVVPTHQYFLFTIYWRAKSMCSFCVIASNYTTEVETWETDYSSFSSFNFACKLFNIAAIHVDPTLPSVKFRQSIIELDDSVFGKFGIPDNLDMYMLVLFLKKVQSNANDMFPL